MALDAYADREYDILYARLRRLLTDREFACARSLAFLGFGYVDAAKRWWPTTSPPTAPLDNGPT